MAELWNKLKNFVSGADYEDEYEDDYYEDDDDIMDEEYEELPPIRPYRSRLSQNTERAVERSYERSVEKPVRTTARTTSYTSTVRSAQPKPTINLQQMQKSSSRSSRVMNINTSVNMQVIVATPKTMEEAGELCTELKERKTIIVNLENVEHETAQRISDFLCGANYALDGTIQLISGEIFVICPIDVELSGQLKEDLRTNALKLTYLR